MSLPVMEDKGVALRHGQSFDRFGNANRAFAEFGLLIGSWLCSVPTSETSRGLFKNRVHRPLSTNVPLASVKIPVLFGEHIGQNLPQPGRNLCVSLSLNLIKSLMCQKESLLNDVRRVKFRLETTIPRQTCEKLQISAKPRQVTGARGQYAVSFYRCHPTAIGAQIPIAFAPQNRSTPAPASTVTGRTSHEFTASCGELGQRP